MHKLHVTWLRGRFVPAEATGLEGVGIGARFDDGFGCIGFGQVRSAARYMSKKASSFHTDSTVS